MSRYHTGGSQAFEGNLGLGPYPLTPGCYGTLEMGPGLMLSEGMVLQLVGILCTAVWAWSREGESGRSKGW